MHQIQDLIQIARENLDFQNDSISLPANNPSDEKYLVNFERGKTKNARVCSSRNITNSMLGLGKDNKTQKVNVEQNFENLSIIQDRDDDVSSVSKASREESNEDKNIKCLIANDDPTQLLCLKFIT